MSQINVEIAASDDDAYRQRTDTIYPPVAGVSGDTTAATLAPRKTFSTPNYNIQTTFVRFDTSTIPDDATVTVAELQIYAGSATNADTRDINFEWYPWTPPLVAGDYAETVGTTANVTALSAITGITSLRSFLLSNPEANVSKSGFTGIRFGISGSTPTGNNELFVRAWDHATDPAPKLNVTYTDFQGSASAAWLTA